MFKKYALAMVATVLAAPCAMASNYPKTVFDASYVITTNGGTKTDMRMASDGKGHFLSQTTAGGQQYSTIVNYLEGTSTSLIPQGKMAMKSKLPPDGGYVADEDSIKQMKGKPLGAKSVNGHPCHGYEYNTSGAKTQTWIGDDCKIVVESVTNAPTGKSVMDLKSIAGKPSDDVFKIPSGYKLMNQ